MRSLSIVTLLSIQFLTIILTPIVSFAQSETPAEYIQNRPAIFRSDAPEVLTDLRHDTSDTFALQVMQTWIPKLVAQRSCDQFIGTCDFYLCQEEKIPCGLEGYNLSYGYKYCSGSKFKLLGQMPTQQGKTWVTEVFKCLQSKSFQDSGTTQNNDRQCKVISSNAYASHPDCYVQAGFCDLSTTEKKLILKLIKSEIFSFAAIVQGFDILKQCASRN